MNKTDRFIPSKRRLAFLFLIIILVTIFILGYNYYYIPTNSNKLNKYAFLILDNIKKNIAERNKDNINLYANIYRNNINNVIQKSVIWNDSIFNKLKKKRRKILDSLPYNECNYNILKSPVNYTSDSIYGNLVTASGNNFIYLFTNLKDSSDKGKSLFISESSDQLLTPILQTNNKKIFKHFLLVSICGKKADVVYNDSKLIIGKEVLIDSLIPNLGGMMLPGIRDIRLEGVNFKMFYTPLELGAQQLTLCAFIKGNEYNSKTHQIPASLIYPLVIVFLLLLIALPIIKIYLIGKHEQIKITDLILFVVSVFFGSTMITLIIIHVILLKDGDISARKDLESLSTQIESEFVRELSLAHKQLYQLDSLISQDSFVTKRINKSDKKINVSGNIESILRKNHISIADFNFDRIAWADSNGQQFMKGQFTDTPLYTRINDRNYFQAFAANNAYHLPNDANSIFALEPVYNWVNGEFRFIISKKSLVPNAFIVTLSTPMLSVTSTVLPAGFGFCIIDNEGNVQVHSEKHLSLNENFLDQLLFPSQITGAIESRQKMYYPSSYFYGKNNAINITPIPDIPFYLITFYDKGYIVPVNIRILVFSLIFCFTSFLITFLIWTVVFWKKHYSNPYIHSPMGLFRWISPKRFSAPYYLRCSAFLIIYTLIVLLLTFLSSFTDPGRNYLILLISLINPINIVAGLVVIIYSPYKHFLATPADSEYLHDKLELLRKKSGRAKKAILTIIITSIVLLLFTKSVDYDIELPFIIFQSILILFLSIYNLFVPRVPETTPEYAKYYRQLYTLLAGLMVIGLAILPALLFSWYPHNQEILQSVKKQQLYFAKKLHERKNDISLIIKIHDNDYLPKNYFEKLQYQNGLYTINRDTFMSTTQSESDTNHFNNFLQLYFDIINNLNLKYYDPLSYPALQDFSHDRLWHWSLNQKDSVILWYKMAPDLSDSSSFKAETRRVLKITSKIPPRFILLSFQNPGLYILIILLVCLFAGMFKLIRSISDSLFLKKYIPENNAELYTETPPKKLLDLYLATPVTDEDLINKLKTLSNEFNLYLPGLPNPEHINYEREIIMTADAYRGFYDFILTKCSTTEKYMLYNFARYGLMNFKDIADIYNLMQKGILIVHDEEIKLFSVSFRAYILKTMPVDMMNTLNKKFKQTSAWNSFRTPFLIILLSVAAFIFFTQEETWQRIVALITGLSSSIPFLFSYFSSPGSSAGKK